MHFSKLINLLQSFDTPRLMRLKEYVHSPYFKVPLSSVNLFDYLYSISPDYTEKKVNPEAIGYRYSNLSTFAKQIFAGSHLLYAIENFIAQEDWQKSPTGVNFHRLRGYKELNLPQKFDKEYEKALEPLYNHPEADIDVFYQKHLFTELSFNGFDARANRVEKNDLRPVLQTLDEFYALKKLRYLCDMLIRQKFFGTPYNGEHIAALLETLAPYKTTQYPYVYLFVHVFLMFRADTYEAAQGPYHLLRSYVEKQPNLSSPSVMECLGYAITHCQRWYNKGYEAAGAEYLWWIGLKMKNNLLLESGQMMPVTYRNIVSIAVIDKKNPEWLERMIKVYSAYLPEEHRAANLAFAKGLYHYNRKEFIPAVRSLLEAEAGEEVIFNSVIRRWQFMCLYECDAEDTDTLFNHLTSFEKYIVRYKEKLAPAKPVFDKFIHYGHELLKARPDNAGEHLSLVLNSEPHFAGKPWLMEQFGTLQRKRTSRPKAELHR